MTMAILLLASITFQFLPALPSHPVRTVPQARNPQRLTSKERIGYLTRRSPRPPDGRTAAYAAGALLAAGVILVLLCRRKGGAGALPRPFLPHLLVLASVCWFGFFLVKGLAVPLFQPPRSFTREPYPFAPPAKLERFLRRLQERLPEDAGVMLINCGEPRQADMVNYFLYPRRVIFKRASGVPIPDPEAFLTDANRALLERLGADWLLNLDTAVMDRDPEAALIPLARSGRGGKEKEKERTPR